MTMKDYHFNDHKFFQVIYGALKAHKTLTVAVLTAAVLAGAGIYGGVHYANTKTEESAKVEDADDSEDSENTAIENETNEAEDANAAEEQPTEDANQTAEQPAEEAAPAPAEETAPTETTTPAATQPAAQQQTAPAAQPAEQEYTPTPKDELPPSEKMPYLRLNFDGHEANAWDMAAYIDERKKDENYVPQFYYDHELAAGEDTNGLVVADLNTTVIGEQLMWKTGTYGNWSEIIYY